MENLNNKLIIVEDDHTLRERLVKNLSINGFTCQACENLDELSLALKKNSFSHALIDLRLGNELDFYESGLDALEKILGANKKCRAVILTGYGTIQTAVKAIQMGAVQYLSKPINIEEIVKTLKGEEKAEVLDSTQELEIPPLAQAEWEHIQNVLNLCSGNISKAAKHLGLHRRSLQRKLAKDPG